MLIGYRRNLIVSQQNINMWDGISCCYIYFIPILFIIVCFLSQNILYLLQAAMILVFYHCYLIIIYFPDLSTVSLLPGKNDFWGIFRKIKISVKNISLIQVYPWFYQLFFLFVLYVMVQLNSITNMIFYLLQIFNF